MVETSLTFVETKLHISSFVVKSFNVVKFSYNRKKTSITFEARLIMCIPFANEGKTQVKWVVAIGHKWQKRANVINTPCKGSPYYVPNLDEMIVRSSCLKNLQKI